MSGLAARMSEFREVIFGILGEIAVISGQEVKGRLHRKYREIELRDGNIVGLDLSFDCQYQVFMGSLSPGDALTVEGGNYRFIRRIPPEGDESGLVILELGSV
jgi:hypothetical protein